MPNSYLPSSDPKLALWAANFKIKISELATTLHLTPDEVVADQQCCDEMNAAIAKVASLKAQLKAAVRERNIVIDTKGGQLRARISRYKTDTNYNEGVGGALGVITPKRTLDVENYKAEISARPYGGQIQIRFVKKLSHGINLYYRKTTELEWKLVSRINKSPFMHEVPLETKGQPENIQYLAYGVVNDEEIGTPSDIVQIVYAG